MYIVFKEINVTDDYRNYIHYTMVPLNAIAQ